MRIISGKYKTRTLPSPKGFTARPTTDFAKENLFNVLNNWYDFDGMKALDVFAGTGSISYELASRGCKSVTCIEKNYKHFEFIKKIVEKVNIQEIEVLRFDAFKYLEKTNSKFDLIFADPPYDLVGIDTIPNIVFNRELLTPKGMLILEHSKDYQFSSHPHFLEVRAYGSVHFSFFE